MTDKTASGTPEKRGTNVVRLVMLLGLLAVVALAGVVVWAGGISGVADLLGLGDPEPVAVIPPQPEIPTQEPGAPADEGTPAAPPPSAVATPGAPGAVESAPQVLSPQAAVVPASAQAAMYREQLQSQSQIGRLVNGEISNIAIGAATVSPDRASIPITVTYRAGGPLSGSMSLTRTSSGQPWFFSSISAGGHPAPPAKLRTVNSGVVATITSQQALASNQDLIARGLVQRGFVSARVDGVTQGSGTATVNVTLLGGALDRTPARFVLISAVDSGQKYWFVTRFELR